MENSEFSGGLQIGWSCSLILTTKSPFTPDPGICQWRAHFLDFILVGKIIFLGGTPPFFPGILLSRKPSEPQGKQLIFRKERWLKRMGNQPLEFYIVASKSSDFCKFTQEERVCFLKLFQVVGLLSASTCPPKMGPQSEKHPYGTESGHILSVYGRQYKNLN